MLRYWFKLLCTNNCILKCLYEDMFESSVVKPNDKLNWAWISQYGMLTM
jgi:hypothetical protein